MDLAVLILAVAKFKPTSKFHKIPSIWERSCSIRRDRQARWT